MFPLCCRWCGHMSLVSPSAFGRRQRPSGPLAASYVQTWASCLCLTRFAPGCGHLCLQKTCKLCQNQFFNTHTQTHPAFAATNETVSTTPFSKRRARTPRGRRPPPWKSLGNGRELNCFSFNLSYIVRCCEVVFCGVSLHVTDVCAGSFPF